MFRTRAAYSPAIRAAADIADQSLDLTKTDRQRTGSASSLPRALESHSHERHQADPDCVCEEITKFHLSAHKILQDLDRPAIENGKDGNPGQSVTLPDYGWHDQSPKRDDMVELVDVARASGMRRRLRQGQASDDGGDRQGQPDRENVRPQAGYPSHVVTRFALARLASTGPGSSVLGRDIEKTGI